MRNRYAVSRARCAGLLLLALACRPTAHPPNRLSAYDPAHALGTLFADVQLTGIFPDSKEFVDARPRAAPAGIHA